MATVKELAKELYDIKQFLLNDPIMGPRFIAYTAGTTPPAPKPAVSDSKELTELETQVLLDNEAAGIITGANVVSSETQPEFQQAYDGDEDSAFL